MPYKNKKTIENRSVVRESSLQSVANKIHKITEVDSAEIRTNLVNLIPDFWSDPYLARPNLFARAIAKLALLMGYKASPFRGDFDGTRTLKVPLIVGEESYLLDVALHQSKAIVCASIAQDKTAFMTGLDDLVQSYKSDILVVVQEWENKVPATWLTSSELLSWSAGLVSARRALVKIDKKDLHPLFSKSVFYPNPEASQDSQIYPFVEGMRTLYYEGSAVSLLSEILIAEAKTSKHPRDVLYSILREKWASFLSVAQSDFLNKHTFSLEHVKWGFTSEQWDVWLKSILSEVKINKLDSELFNKTIQKLYNSKLTNYRKELMILRCKEEMPTTIVDLYPVARSLNRKLTFIHGPTNSGKTYHALELLKKAASGVYLGPLRLLALEVYETLNHAEILTDLVTGEHTQFIPGAQHISSTIEMLNLRKEVEIAVIDEAQMLGDENRGSAWLQAILGAPAKHVVILGSSTALPAIRDLAEIMGEPLEEIVKTRLNPLKVLDRPTSLKDVKPGTALIVFSRKDALGLTAHLRSQGKTVSVIYGALSPEVRTEQARQFRSGENDLLISTDAIGLGLNLPVHTVLFTTQTKFNGQVEDFIPRPLLQQIAGRAGRYGIEDCGYVGAVDTNVLKFVRNNYTAILADVHAPFRFSITSELAQNIAKNIESESLLKVLEFFKTQLKLESWVINSVTEDQLILAQWLDHQCPQTLPVRLMLSSAPALHKGSIDPYYFQMVKMILGLNGNLSALLDPLPYAQEVQPGDLDSSALDYLENKVRSLTLYCWMQQRFPTVLTQESVARERLRHANLLVTAALQRTAGKRCSSCAKTLAWNHTFNICQSCFDARQSDRDYWSEYRY